jgi:hypothetical protein
MFVVCDDGMCSSRHGWSKVALNLWVFQNLRTAVVNRMIYWRRNAYYAVVRAMFCFDYLELVRWCSLMFGRWMTLFGRD